LLVRRTHESDVSSWPILLKNALVETVKVH
jgi:hypothetical protein